MSGKVEEKVINTGAEHITTWTDIKNLPHRDLVLSAPEPAQFPGSIDQDRSLRECRPLTLTESIVSSYFPIGAGRAATTNLVARKRGVLADLKVETVQLNAPNHLVRSGTDSAKTASKEEETALSRRNVRCTDDSDVDPFPSLSPFGPDASSSLCTLYPGAVPWMRTYMKAATSALQERMRPPKPVRESPPFLSTDAANDNTQKHLQSFAKTMRTIFRIVGSFEATFMAVRGCFYGVLYGLEYGAQGLHVLSEFPAIRIAFDIFEHFWNYVKLLGRKGPFIGFLALICTYIGRSLIPILRDLLPAVCDHLLPTSAKQVYHQYDAKTPLELSVAAGERVIVEERTIELAGEQMVVVRKPVRQNGQIVKGLVPKRILSERVEKCSAKDSPVRRDP